MYKILTFNLPNLTNKFIEFSNNPGTYISAGLPQHTHGEQFIFSEGLRPLSPTYNGSNTDGRTKTITTNINHNSRDDDGIAQTLNASNSIYGNSTTVQPPALTLNGIIKY